MNVNNNTIFHNLPLRLFYHLLSYLGPRKITPVKATDLSVEKIDSQMREVCQAGRALVSCMLTCKSLKELITKSDDNPLKQCRALLNILQTEKLSINKLISFYDEGRSLEIPKSGYAYAILTTCFNSYTAFSREEEKTELNTIALRIVDNYLPHISEQYRLPIDVAAFNNSIPLSIVERLMKKECEYLDTSKTAKKSFFTNKNANREEFERLLFLFTDSQAAQMRIRSIEQLCQSYGYSLN